MNDVQILQWKQKNLLLNNLNQQHSILIYSFIMCTNLDNYLIKCI